MTNHVLKQAQLQLDQLEEDLASLKADLLPINPARFFLMAEGYVEQIRSVREQIDNLTGVAALEAARTGVLIRLVGPAVGLGVASASILGNTILEFRKSIRAIAATLHGQQHYDSGVISEGLERSSDFVLLNVLPGSLQIALDLPVERQLILVGDTPDPAASALDLFMQAAAWASVEESDEQLNSKIENMPHWRMILSRIISMSPHDRGPVTAVEFSGNLVHTSVSPRLTAASRLKARKATTETDGGQYAEAIGVMREIDLDKRRFQLRQRPNGDPDLPCTVIEDMIEDARNALGETVLVAGSYAKIRKNVKRVLNVTSFEILPRET